MSPIPSPTLLPADFWALGAVFALTAGVLLLLLLEIFPAGANSNRGAVLSLLSLAVGAWAVFRVREVKRTLFEGMFVHDGFTLFFTLLFCGIAAVAVLLSWDYVKRTRINQTEFYALLLSATLGMIIMAASNDLITIFLGLELMSLALYVLVGFQRNRLDSNEAAMKYFLLGAFATGFLLYGIALVYGATGATRLDLVAARLGSVLDRRLLLAGVAMLLVAFGFKVAAVPFHMWTPDVYEGAPTSVTALMAVAVKSAGFAAFARVFLYALGGLHADWSILLWVLAVATMTVGNVLALVQRNIKRMLAYSSIAHAGYILVALTAGGPVGGAAALFYLLAYAWMNLGAFGVVLALGRRGEPHEDIADYAGLGFRSPFAAVMMTIFLFSLTGLPPTAGFIGKMYLFAEVINRHYFWLAVIGVLNSVVSLFYYMKVAKAMWFSGEEANSRPALRLEPLHTVVMALLAAPTLVLGLYWSYFKGLADWAVAHFAG
jgi:NADH-quinone oxidoreductase subunit N